MTAAHEQHADKPTRSVAALTFLLTSRSPCLAFRPQGWRLGTPRCSALRQASVRDTILPPNWPGQADAGFRTEVPITGAVT